MNQTKESKERRSPTRSGFATRPCALLLFTVQILLAGVAQRWQRFSPRETSIYQLLLLFFLGPTSAVVRRGTIVCSVSKCNWFFCCCWSASLFESAHGVTNGYCWFLIDLLFGNGFEIENGWIYFMYLYSLAAEYIRYDRACLACWWWLLEEIVYNLAWN